MYTTPPRSGRMSGFAPGDRSGACFSLRMSLSGARNTDADLIPVLLTLTNCSNHEYSRKDGDYSPSKHQVSSRGL
jgi:hypothetical protein